VNIRLKKQAEISILIDRENIISELKRILYKMDIFIKESHYWRR